MNHAQGAAGQNDIGRECKQLHRSGSLPLKVVRAPANIDLDVASNRKARVLQALRECRYSRMTLRIIRRAVHQHADVLHSFGLLRARR